MVSLITKSIATLATTTDTSQDPSWMRKLRDFKVKNAKREIAESRQKASRCRVLIQSLDHVSTPLSRACTRLAEVNKFDIIEDVPSLASEFHPINKFEKDFLDSVFEYKKKIKDQTISPKICIAFLLLYKCYTILTNQYPNMSKSLKIEFIKERGREIKDYLLLAFFPIHTLDGFLQDARTTLDEIGGLESAYKKFNAVIFGQSRINLIMAKIRKDATIQAVFGIVEEGIFDAIDRSSITVLQVTKSFMSFTLSREAKESKAIVQLIAGDHNKLDALVRLHSRLPPENQKFSFGMHFHMWFATKYPDKAFKFQHFRSFILGHEVFKAQAARNFETLKGFVEQLENLGYDFLLDSFKSKILQVFFRHLSAPPE